MKEKKYSLKKSGPLSGKFIAFGLMLTLIVTFGIALLIFHTLILQPIAVSYPNFLLSMTPQTYLIIFGLYFVISILIMSLTISRFINKSAVEMERSGD
ncbi:MAG: hypothetical protein SOT80_03380 [Candidatus Pseudoruminococcus sp.]|nr:hypothetical protein [Candidatus Pseudoruminococcus sp.]